MRLTGDLVLLRRGWTVALPGWLRSDIRVEAPSPELPLGDVMWLGGTAPVLRFTACPAVFASGISPTGRVLREFVFQGLNAGEGGEPVFDGIHADSASARRGEFNRRYAQPGLLSPMMPDYGPPYDSAALLARQRELGGVPKLLLTNSAWEYWRGDGALVHLGPAGPVKRAMPLANPSHNLDRGPVLRALFTRLEQWAVDGFTPPPGAVPRQADGTAVSRETVLESIRERFPAASSACPRWRPG